MEEEEEEEERLKPDCQTMPNSQPQNFHSDKWDNRISTDLLKKKQQQQQQKKKTKKTDKTD